jgi:hypothetical protein
VDDEQERRMAEQWSTGTMAPGAEGGGVKEQAGAVAGTAAEQAASVAGTAGEQVGNVASTAVEGVKEVAGQGVQQAATVVSEATTQAKDLVGQAGHELRSQGDAQTERIAEVLRGLATQVQALVEGRAEEAGPLPDLARQATDQLQSIAGRIGDNGIQGVATDVQQFARRRPGAFLAGAAVFGFAAGRLLRGAQAAGSQASPSMGTTPSVPQPAASPALRPGGPAFAGATADGSEVILLEDDPTTVGTLGTVPTPVGGGFR